MIRGRLFHLTTFILTLSGTICGIGTTGIMSRSRGFLNNYNHEDIFVKSVAIGGRIAGSAVSVNLKPARLTHESDEPLQRGRQKRDEEISNPTRSKNSIIEKPMKDEPDEGPTRTFVGVVGYQVDLECDVHPAIPGDQLQLILWYREGHPSPIYTFDAREKSMLSYATHYSNEAVFGPRARMRISPNQKNAILAIEHLQVEDEGIYKCRTDFKRSPTKNNKMAVSIIIPPKKPMVHDSNGRKMVEKLGPFKIGDDLTATCVTVGGKPPPKLTWWREHALLDDSFEVVNGRTTNTFTLTNIRRQDLGTVFTCQAVNNNQSVPVATTLRLDLTFPPVSTAITSDRKRSLTSGREEQLECQCKGTRPAPLFQWFIGGRELENSQDFMTVHYDPEAMVATAKIRFVPMPEDNGKYLACRTVNEYFPMEPKEDGYIVNVNYVPVSLIMFGRSLNPKNIREGDDVYFECHVKSNPPFFNITWRQNGKFLVENVSNGIIIGNQTLVLQKIRREDAGLYTCVASNQEGDGESNAQYLNIKFTPVCKEGQRITYGAAMKSDTEVVCRVDANPTPHHFKWQFKTLITQRTKLGTNLIADQDGEDIKDMVDLPSNRYTIEHDHSILKYRVMTEADYGFLYCWAENSVGDQTSPCIFEVVRESAPEPLTACVAVNMTWERVRVECRAGFDGGHPPMYILEAYVLPTVDTTLPQTSTSTQPSLVYNVTSNENPPGFDIVGLVPGTDYNFVMYVSNSLGISNKASLNITTLNMAEKRTAETRSKLEPLSDQEVETSRARGGVDALESGDVDPGLALLPIIAILCGVAVGLGTVALGIVLLVRGRTHEEESEGIDSRAPDEGSLGGGRYDSICQSPKSDLVPETDEASIQLKMPKSVKLERFTTLPRSGQSSSTRVDSGSLQRRGYNLAPGDEVPTCQQMSMRGGSGSPIAPPHKRSCQDTPRACLDSTFGPGMTHSRSLQRTVHFETPLQTCDSDLSTPLMSSPSSSSASGGCAIRNHRVNFMEVLSEETGSLLPAPPATFSDPPTLPRGTVPPSKGFAVGQQLLRVHAPPSGSQAGLRELESSFVTFCSPNLETKKRDIVNATRL